MKEQVNILMDKEDLDVIISILDIFKTDTEVYLSSLSKQDKNWKDSVVLFFKLNEMKSRFFEIYKKYYGENR